MGHYHSVELIKERCIGCTDCIKRCPTEAIRVTNGKAVIMDDRCIDCGMCIRICRNRAKAALTQPLKTLENYKYRIALPAPTLYGQFQNVTNVNVILTALKKIGFDDVYEVARAAEAVTDATVGIIKSGEYEKPVISSACPVIVRLICQRFPSLIGNILQVISPLEVAAIAARRDAVESGIKDEDIGIFFISPCSAKATSIINPLGVEKTRIEGVISIQDIYLPMMSAMKKIKEPEALCQSYSGGMDWAVSGGESKGIKAYNAIAVDGIENIIPVLEAIENEQLENVDFVEVLACVGGCLGGPLTAINCFLAKNNMSRVHENTKNIGGVKKRYVPVRENEINFGFEKELRPAPVLKLDDDMEIAIRKMEEMQTIYEQLPAIDCGSCGAPTCRALAEDIVRGTAHVEDCIFMLRKKVKYLAEMMVDLASKMPQTMSEEDAAK